MEDSIFTKIIRGEIPSHKVYEDEYTYAFLDIHPVNEGHVLVVPKVQVEFIWDLDATSYATLMSTVKKLATHMRTVYPDHYVSELIVGVDVPHAHVHLIPFTEASQLQRAFDRQSIEPEHASLTVIAEKLRIL